MSEEDRWEEDESEEKEKYSSVESLNIWVDEVQGLTATFKFLRENQFGSITI